MVEPRIVPREAHPISRRNIDPDALKVLYRLKQFDHVAYLVGGSVRDLLLGRHPKDYDIGTSAHPYQVKKLFRNCWIIGRRFRLAHVRFGPKKVIEVATFRRQVESGEEIVQDGVPAPDPSTPEGEHLIHHDNTFGTPEQDAFRRDFTVNALFYDIATFSVIDYVDGLKDLHASVVRSIGDPDVRLREDPVRMLRAIALAARLDFVIDPTLLKSIRTHRHEIAKSAPARLLEEYYKILRAGSSEKAFRALADVGLLEAISGELHKGAGEALWRSLAALDAHRARFESIPETLTNPILLGSLLVPLGVNLQPAREARAPRLGALPLARRDVERLRQLLGLQRRLRDVSASPRAQRAVAHRHIFREALTWLEIHGGAPELVARWKALRESAPSSEGAEQEGRGAGMPGSQGTPGGPGLPGTPGIPGMPGKNDEAHPFGRRRRRRRRRRRISPTQGH
jgi:poly(A) polymerase